jgi:hypothetical protein
MEASVARAVISDPKRRTAYEPLYDIDPQTGASVEIFHADRVLATSFGMSDAGWYFWSCQCGSLPSDLPIGPFGTSYAAYREALGGGKRLFVKEALFQQSDSRGEPNTWPSRT